MLGVLLFLAVASILTIFNEERIEKLIIPKSNHYRRILPLEISIVLKLSCESVWNSYKQTYDSLHNSLLNIKYQNIKFADENIAVVLYLLTDYMLGKHKDHSVTEKTLKSIVDEGLYFEEFDNRLAFFAKFLNGKPTICDWAFEPPFSEADLKDIPPLNLFIALWDVLYIPARLDNYDDSVRLITDFSYQIDIWKEFLDFLPTLTDFINKLYRVRYDLGLYGLLD